MKLTARCSKLFALSMLAAPLANATITWQTDSSANPSGSTNVISDHQATPAPLPADPTPVASYEGIGYFVQLIWAGPNGTIDLIDTLNYVAGSRVGTEGTDDVVLDTSFIGRGRNAAPGTTANPNGKIINQSSPEASSSIGGGTANQVYYVRAFNAPIAALSAFDAPGTFIPAAATHYGNSATFITSNTNDATAELFTIGSFRTDIPLAVIPEPTTAGLMGMGILGVVAALRKRKQQW